MTTYACDHLADPNVQSLRDLYGISEEETRESEKISHAARTRLGASEPPPRLTRKNLRRSDLADKRFNDLRSPRSESSSSSKDNTLKKLNKAFWKTAAIATSILCYTVAATIILVPTVGLLTPIAPAILAADPLLITLGSLTLPLFLSMGKSMRTTNNHMFWNTLKKKGAIQAIKVHWKNMKVDSGKAYWQAVKQGFRNYPKYLTLATGAVGVFAAFSTGQLDKGIKNGAMVWDSILEKEWEGSRSEDDSDDESEAASARSIDGSSDSLEEAEVDSDTNSEDAQPGDED